MKKPRVKSGENHAEAQLQSAIAKRNRTKKLSAFQQRMKNKLDSGQFRMLNESMYTTTGADSLQLMREDPRLFQLYHTGYAEQVKRWPKNPLDAIIQYLNTQSGSKRIADLGCGEARLAKEVRQKQVKSFDLVAANDDVVECDIANVPLPDSSVDIAVFCLSLMGTNYGDFIKEARRILVPKGLVIVAEVASRFEDQDPADFVAGVESVGFRSDERHPLAKLQTSQSDGNTQKRRRGRGGRRRKRKQGVAGPDESASKTEFFYTFAFRSTKKEVVESADGIQRITALPKLAACVYKKR